MRLPITIVHGMKVAPAKPFSARSVSNCDAGRHCQRSLVDGSGIKFASDAIAPVNAVVESSVSLAPRGLQGRGLALRRATAHHPMVLVFGSAFHLVCPNLLRSSSTVLTRPSGSSFRLR